MYQEVDGMDPRGKSLTQTDAVIGCWRYIR